jgi:endonuclease/exonuclease/phosphatase (EEP) superfamily protein YafD
VTRAVPSTRAFGAAVITWLAVAGCARTRPFETPRGPHLRVLTYNVNWGCPAPRSALEAILEARADVICLQETTPTWESFLRPALLATHPHSRIHHDGAAGGQIVFSRWPVAEVGAARPAGAYFAGWFLRLDTPIGQVQTLSVHLRPPVDDQGRFGVGPYFSTKTIRLKELQELCAHLEPDVPTLILGDFNEKDGGPALTWLRAQGFTDALREFDRRSPTWRWQTSTVTLRARLDHVFHSGHLYALEARVIPKGGSDHFPLLAVLEARRAKRPDEADGTDRPANR